MASEEDSFATITIKGTPVTELRVTDIKKELEKRGLSKSGSKTQLLDRLKAQLLLEKLQQDAAQSSGDEHEGKVPNIALQEDNKAGQSEFVRQYLQQQQRNLEIQREMKKQVEEERKRKSVDESCEEEPVPVVQTIEPPDVTLSRKVKDDVSNAPTKEEGKMPRPARKSSRNPSKGENGEGEQISKRSRPITPEHEKLRERVHSGASSSSCSPTDKNQRSKSGSTRGRGKIGDSSEKRRTRKESRSSSHSSSPEVMPKKKQRHKSDSSSPSRSRSPPVVTVEAPTRRFNRNSNTGQKPAPELGQEEDMPHDGGGDKVLATTKETLKKKIAELPSAQLAPESKQSKILKAADTKHERQGLEQKLNEKSSSSKYGAGESFQESRPIPIKNFSPKELTAKNPGSALKGNEPTAPVGKNTFSDKLIVEEKKNRTDSKSLEKSDKSQAVEKISLPQTKGNSGHQSPSRNRSQRNRSNSTSSRSRSKSPTKDTRSRSRSSSTSSSDSHSRSSSSDSSSDGSTTKTASSSGLVRSQDNTGALKSPSSHNVQEVEGKVKDSAEHKISDNKTDKAGHSCPSGVSKSRNLPQDDKRKYIDKLCPRG